MRSKDEQARHVAELKARAEKNAAKVGTKLNKVTRGAADKVASAAKTTQRGVVKAIHHVMGSDEYKKKAGEVNERLAAVIQSLEDSIARRDIEIGRLRKRIAELESRFGRA
jgi:negative regulator of replication initiation